MSERQRIAFLAGCLFVIGMHLKTAGRLLVDGWFGPYADEPTIASVAVRDWQRPVESEHAANVAREFVAADR